MKSLNLAQPLVLMIVGLPGAGKSFFARQFSEMFGSPVVSFDRIRYELAAEPTYSNDENDMVGRVAGYVAEEFLKTGRSFLVDGGCNSRAERAKITAVAKKANYGTLTVWVQTDELTCRARATRRNPSKRADDVLNPSLSEQTFETLSRRFTEPTRENYVVISGKHTYNTQARMVLRKLVAPRASEAEAAHHQELEQARRPRVDGGSRRSVIIR